MYKLNKKFNIAISVAIGLATFCVVSAPAHADDGEVHTELGQATSSQSTAASSYDYTANPGDSLTKLVRRSVQLLGQARSTELSEAAAVYCETNAVQRLGGRLLDVGENVTVPFSVLQEYIDNAKNLTAEQLARWQKYANQANFELATVTPDNLAAAQAVTTSPPVSEQTEQPPAEQPAENQPNEQQNQTDSSSLEWYWWVLGILGIGVVYYLAGRRISK